MSQVAVLRDRFLTSWLICVSNTKAAASQSFTKSCVHKFGADPRKTFHVEEMLKGMLVSNETLKRNRLLPRME